MTKSQSSRMRLRKDGGRGNPVNRARLGGPQRPDRSEMAKTRYSGKGATNFNSGPCERENHITRRQPPRLISSSRNIILLILQLQPLSSLRFLSLPPPHRYAPAPEKQTRDVRVAAASKSSYGSAAKYPTPPAVACSNHARGLDDFLWM